MSDDWRLEIELQEEGEARKLLDQLEAAEPEPDQQASFADRIVVSRDRTQVFCYASTREQIERAEQLVRALAGEQGWRVEYQLSRWHPVAERWEEPEKPLPATAAEMADERTELMQREREEMLARGYPEFEVRVQCSSRHEAVEFEENLRSEGLPTTRRWRYLLIGAADEVTASALAQRLRAEAPPDCEITVEGTANATLAEQPPNPFAILGGLAG